MFATDKEIISSAIALVNEGMRVTFPVKGASMLPFIIGGRESVELVRPEGLKVGDVVLAWVDGQRYVVHRIIDIGADGLTLMGDGNVGPTEHCQASDVRAKVASVIDAKGRSHPIDNPWRQRAVRLWWHLRPVRRWLIAIYRRTPWIHSL